MHDPLTSGKVGKDYDSLFEKRVRGRQTGLQELRNDIKKLRSQVDIVIVSHHNRDGATIGIAAVATHAINPWLFAKMPYDAAKDFAPVTQMVRVPNVLVMNAETAARLLGLAGWSSLFGFRELAMILSRSAATMNPAPS